MKVIPIALQSHMDGGTTTLAHIVKLTRRDGFVLAAALDHDRPIPFEGLVYQPALGMAPTDIETTGNLSVDNLDAKGALMLLGVSEKDIACGLWDMCEVRVMRVNWMKPSDGAEKLKRGWFGEISVGRDSFSNEVRTLTQKLQQTIGDLVRVTCRHDLFDNRCKVAPTEGQWKFSGVHVTAAASAREITAASLSQPDGFFSAGKVTWTSGANAGLSMEIRTHTVGGNLELQEPMPYAVEVDDQLTIFAGCLKRWDIDCRDKFGNLPNHGGFPFLPGQDQMYKGNDASI